MIGRQLPLFTPSKRHRPARAQYLARLAGRTEANNPTDRQARRAFELALYTDRRGAGSEQPITAKAGTLITATEQREAIAC